MGIARVVRRRIDTEALLQWAVRDELSKNRGVAGEGGSFALPDFPSVSPMFRIAALGTAIDASSHTYELPPVFAEAIHPDALAIERAILALEKAPIDWPATRRSAMGPLGGLLEDNDPALSQLTIDCAGLVAVHARLRTRPRWDLWPAPGPIVNSRNGKVAVATPDGTPAKSHGGKGGVPWYPEGAASPLRWDPGPREAAYARIEYSIWWQALDTLGDYLRDVLVDYEALAPQAPPCPWADE